MNHWTSLLGLGVCGGRMAVLEAMRADSALHQVHMLTPPELLPLAMEEAQRRQDQLRMSRVEALESLADDARAGRLRSWA